MSNATLFFAFDFYFSSKIFFKIFCCQKFSLRFFFRCCRMAKFQMIRMMKSCTKMNFILLSNSFFDSSTFFFSIWRKFDALLSFRKFFFFSGLRFYSRQIESFSFFILMAPWLAGKDLWLIYEPSFFIFDWFSCVWTIFRLIRSFGSFIRVFKSFVEVVFQR